MIWDDIQYHNIVGQAGEMSKVKGVDNRGVNSSAYSACYVSIYDIVNKRARPSLLFGINQSINSVLHRDEPRNESISY